MGIAFLLLYYVLLCEVPFMLRSCFIAMLGVVYAESSVFCCYAECHCAKCRNAKCHVFIVILSVCVCVCVSVLKV
jgi:hypothetical protein